MPINSKDKADDSKPVKNKAGDEIDSLTGAFQSKAKVSSSESPVDKFAALIESGGCKNILALSGAGVSVAAGIPDFRTPGTGLYDNLQKYNLPYAEAVFDVEFYRNNPKPFVALAKEIWPGLKHAPTLTHTFITLLAEKGLLLRNYSQNIDGLEFMADLDPELLVECHGHFRSASCIRCKTAADGLEVKKTIVEEGKAPTCAKCKSYVKPDIVFFGEGLPNRFHRLLNKDMDKADCVLVLGTSLQVAPVSMIPDMVDDVCKRVLVNRELVGSIQEDDDSGRDIFLQGNCDDTIKELADRLGWLDELMVKNKTARGAILKSSKSTIAAKS